jgi:three-Cys-motif partner protein
MGLAKFKEHHDGHSARHAPPWSEEKLMILDAYLAGGPERKGGFAKACSTSPTGWYALDLFAGTGINWSESRGEFIDGSPLIALKAGPPEAKAVIMAENDQRCYAALKDRTAKFGDRAKVFNRDANEAIGEMLTLIPTRAPSFAFLDPEGSELNWNTVEQIAAHKAGQRFKIEQLALFPTDMGFVRLIPDYPEKVDRLFGHKNWRKVLDRRNNGTYTADQARTAYVQMYADGFKQLGYSVVLDRQIKKPSGQPMYFLIFASDHESAGKEIMQYVFKGTELGGSDDLRLFDIGPKTALPSRLSQS